VLTEGAGSIPLQGKDIYRLTREGGHRKGIEGGGKFPVVWKKKYFREYNGRKFGGGVFLGGGGFVELEDLGERHGLHEVTDKKKPCR